MKNWWDEGLVYQSDPDDPDFDPPDSSLDADGGSDSSESGVEGDCESDRENDDRENDDRENDGDDDRADDRAAGEDDGGDGEDDKADDGAESSKKRKRGKEKKDVPEEDLAERFEFEIEEAVANWFDEFQIRRNQIPEDENEDEDPVITRDRKIRLASDDKLAIGRTFFTGFEFKETVLHYAMKHRINAKQSRWEKDKISFRCAQRKECEWYVYASYDNERQLWVVKTKCLDHVCTSNGKCKLLKRRVIGRLFMDKLRLQPNFMPLDIQRHIKEQWKLVSTIGQVQDGRLLALKWLKEEYAQQFAHLRGYVAEIMTTNPGSTAIVDTIPDAKGNDVFNRIYVCLGAMKNAFYYYRPLIGIDGTFLKHAVKGCLFTAIAHDANNQIYPVAWATVQSENADNWLWFLNQLKHDLNLKDGSGYVVISDRCKGIISAVKSALPNAEHRPCVKHIVENLKKRHGSLDLLKKLVWNLAWSYSDSQYKANLNEMRAYIMSLYEDVMKEEPKNWCRAWFRLGSYCEDVDNNATESFNATVVKARAKALIPMMETIRRQAMARIMTKGTHGKFEVWKDGSSNAVNLTTEEWDCSCCKWQVTGIPCEHAYAAINDVGKDVEDYVVPMFNTHTWQEQYETGPEPVRGQMYWPTGLRLITAPLEDPVPPGRKKGEKKNYNRIKGPNEPPKKKKKKGEPEKLKLGRKGTTMHCRSCGEAGHNAVGCKKFPKEKKSRKKKNQDDEAAGSSQPPKEKNTKKTKKSQGTSTSQPKIEHQETTQGPDTITLTQRSSQWDQWEPWE
ncbi:Zinc finger SWIM-type [Arabidopsis thaliana x Arabidopsis arenosa]|uniref:Zinc finger SWIM-type n=1 Tax=Arabidopsis thaliana x Arabidopsis arenosa TaxID=1240361 RepID=A0A8T2C5P1_9BRAS|nr:Zinc finger SWIM-type [Arabidopsis thaliana x Arabidopsis arenosa]